MRQPGKAGIPRIGLALGAGGARGWAHIGVIRALQARGVQPDIVCGTSIGALVGAACAAGELDRLERWVSDLTRREVLKLVDVTWRGGLIRGRRLFDFLRARFPDRDIETLALPFAAVATELATGREIWLRQGSVLDAVRASIAMPGVFSPVARAGELLVDGGLVNPVPVSVCRALGAELVIAVDLGRAKLGRRRGARTPVVEPMDQTGEIARSDPGWLARVFGAKQENGARMPSIIEVILTSTDIVQERVARSRLAGEPADVLVTPWLPDLASTDFHRGREAIAEGQAALERVHALLDQALEA